MAAYPAIRSLQAAHIPNIILVVREGSFASVAPLLKEGITIHTVPHERDRKRLRHIAQEIRANLGRVDLCIQGMTRETTASLLFLRQLKARTNLGLHESRLSMYLSNINLEAVRMHDALVPANICWAHLMKDAGFNAVSSAFELPIPDDIDHVTRAHLAPFSPYIAFNLDGSADKRRFDVATAAGIAQRVHAVSGYPVLLLCAPDGEQKALQLAETAPYIHLLPLPRSLAHSAAIIKYSACVITPDTSIVHIASAYNRPTIAFYRHTVKGWAPQAERSTAIITGEHLTHFDMEDVCAAIMRVVSTDENSATT